MFSKHFEKQANVLSAIGKGLASGASKASWNPTQAMSKMKDWGKVTGAAHNIGALAKQYGPSAAGIFAAGRLSKDSGNQTNNNIAVSR